MKETKENRKEERGGQNRDDKRENEVSLIFNFGCAREERVRRNETSSVPYRTVPYCK